MTTHELANLLLSRTETLVSDQLATRLLNRPSGAIEATGTCWCGCEAPTKGKFAPGHDARFHGLALKVARGQAEMPESFVSLAAEEDFMKWYDRESDAIVRKANAIVRKAEEATALSVSILHEAQPAS